LVVEIDEIIVVPYGIIIFGDSLLSESLVEMTHKKYIWINILELSFEFFIAEYYSFSLEISIHPEVFFFLFFKSKHVATKLWQIFSDNTMSNRS